MYTKYPKEDKHRHLDLEWNEYLLREEQRPPHRYEVLSPVTSNRNIYIAIAMMFACFALISYILSFFIVF